MNLFADYGFLPSIQKTLKELGLVKATEIQSQIIPLILSGQSVVGVSETGSGKTLAYALPILQIMKLLEDDGDRVRAEATPRVVVMVPTRELGEQVAKVFKQFTHETRLRVRSALGGMTAEQARRNTSGPFEILLATPGRIVKMLDEQLLDLSDVRMLVFDEADQMMDQGFLPDTNFVVNQCPDGVHLSLFSATISNSVQKLINEMFADAEVVRSSQSGKVVDTLVTHNLKVEDGKRWPLLEKTLKHKTEGGSILFTNTREQCDKIARELNDRGYDCVIYRGDMDKAERRTNLKKFTSGEVDLLVATDLAGRGLDIPSVGRVINYHLPKEMENYLHRVGRTARAGRKGVVINLVTDRDHSLISRLKTGGKVSLDQKLKHEPKPKTQSKFDPRARARKRRKDMKAQ